MTALLAVLIGVQDRITLERVKNMEKGEGYSYDPSPQFSSSAFLSGNPVQKKFKRRTRRRGGNSVSYPETKLSRKSKKGQKAVDKESWLDIQSKCDSRPIFGKLDVRSVSVSRLATFDTW